MKRTLNSLVLLVMAALAVSLAPSRASAQQQRETICLAGTSWDGSETLCGYGDLTFHFHDDGTVTMVDADGESCGRWRQCGARVTLTFYGGNVVYSGVIPGDSMGGSARNCRRCWNWSLERR